MDNKSPQEKIYDSNLRNEINQNYLKSVGKRVLMAATNADGILVHFDRQVISVDIKSQILITNNEEFFFEELKSFGIVPPKESYAAGRERDNDIRRTWK